MSSWGFQNPRPFNSQDGVALKDITKMVQNLPIYPPQKVQRIATELSTAVRAFPSLIPEVARFTFDNGSFVNLLRLRGTIPINYRGGSYSIPIAIWITQFHPDRAPVTYVIPTGDMEINPTHRHVDKAGLVYHGYLNQWKPSHNIIGLIHELINIFSGATPLYQRQTPKPLEQPKISHNISSSGDNQRKSFLLARMQEKTRSEMEVAHKNKEPEFDALVKEKQALQQISDQMLSKLNSLNEESLSASQRIEQLKATNKALEMWIAKYSEPMTIEKLIAAEPKVKQQLIDCNASNLAMQDAMYILDEAVAKGDVITHHEFIKGVRSMAAKQFLQRALQRKIMLVLAEKERGTVPFKDGYASYG